MLYSQAEGTEKAVCLLDVLQSCYYHESSLCSGMIPSFLHSKSVKSVRVTEGAAASAPQGPGPTDGPPGTPAGGSRTSEGAKPFTSEW